MRLRGREILKDENPSQCSIEVAAPFSKRDQLMLAKNGIRNAEILLGKKEFRYQCDIVENEIKVSKKSGMPEKLKMSVTPNGFEMQGRNINIETEANIGSSSKSLINKVAEISKVNKNIKKPNETQNKSVSSRKKLSATIAVTTNRKSKVQHEDACQAIENDVAATSGVSSIPALFQNSGEEIGEQTQDQNKVPNVDWSVRKKLLLRISKDAVVDQNNDTNRAEKLTEKLPIVRRAKNGVKNQEKSGPSEKKNMTATIASINHKAKSESKVPTEESAKTISAKLIPSDPVQLPKKVALPIKKRLSATIGPTGHKIRKKRDVRDENAVQSADKRLDTVVISTSKQQIVDVDIIECWPILKNNGQQEKRNQSKFQAVASHHRKSAVGKEQSIISQIFSQDDTNIAQRVKDTTNHHFSHVYDANCNICQTKKLGSARKESIEAQLKVFPLQPEAPPTNVELNSHVIAESSPSDRARKLEQNPWLKTSHVAWNGTVVWGSKFRMSCSLSAIYNRVAFTAGAILPAEIKVIGMIDSKLASQNVLCMRLDRRKSQLAVFLVDVPSGFPTDFVLLMYEANSLDRKSLEEYAQFYQLMKTNHRYGILNFVGHPQVLDAYVLPFEEQEMISEHIKSLDGPGLSSEMRAQEIILLLAFLEEGCCSTQAKKGVI